MPIEYIPCYEFAINVKTFDTRKWEHPVNSIVKDYGIGYRDNTFEDLAFDAVRGWSCYSPEDARNNALKFCASEVALLSELLFKLNEANNDK
jgi:hypothetical protein